MEAPSHDYTCVCRTQMTVDRFLARRLVRCPRCLAFVRVPGNPGEGAEHFSFLCESARLRIEPAAPRHWREVQAILSDRRNYHYEISNPTSPRETRKRLRRSRYPAGFARSNKLTLRATRLGGGDTVAVVHVNFHQPWHAAEIGFMVHADSHRQGFGRESVEAACDHLQTRGGVEKVTAMCDSRNAACIALLEGCGFVREGFAIKSFYHVERGWIDSPIYARYRESADST